MDFLTYWDSDNFWAIRMIKDNNSAKMGKKWEIMVKKGKLDKTSDTINP